MTLTFVRTKKVSLTKTNMSSSKEIIRSFRELVSKLDLDDYETKRGEYEGEDLFLNTTQCPSGLVPCDDSTQECPDEGVWPRIYNSEGNRCFTREGVAYKKKMSKKDSENAVKGIRALVEEVAKTQRLLGEVDNAMKMQSPGDIDGRKAKQDKRGVEFIQNAAASQLSDVSDYDDAFASAAKKAAERARAEKTAAERARAAERAAGEKAMAEKEAADMELDKGIFPRELKKVEKKQIIEELVEETGQSEKDMKEKVGRLKTDKIKPSVLDRSASDVDPSEKEEWSWKSALIAGLGVFAGSAAAYALTMGGFDVTSMVTPEMFGTVAEYLSKIMSEDAIASLAKYIFGDTLGPGGVVQAVQALPGVAARLAISGGEYGDNMSSYLSDSELSDFYDSDDDE
jgi:hypothetical protein